MLKRIKRIISVDMDWNKQKGGKYFNIVDKYGLEVFKIKHYDND